MKKIITVFDVTDAPWHVLSFGCKVAKQHGAIMHGIFLHEPTGDTEFKYGFPNDLSLIKDKGSDETVDVENQSLVTDNIKLFKDECEVAGIEYKIDKDFTLKQVLEESSSAELVVADTRAEFNKDLLKNVTIPVCLVSEKELPDQLVLMYDGSDSADHAVNSFSTLFPEWTQLHTDLISVNHPQDDLRSKVESLKHKFPNLTETYLQGSVEKELLNFLENKRGHFLVVKGSFGRSAVSQFFKQSLARAVLEKTRVSVFTAHT